MATIEKFIEDEIARLIENSISESKLRSIGQKHDRKIHLIPKDFRIFGGVLQSMNIQFGNLIERLLVELVDREPNLEVNRDYSGQKFNNFLISKHNEALIDAYVARAKSNEKTFDPSKELPLLQQQVFERLHDDGTKHKNDIDLLFKDKTTGVTYYVESKFNDDHDTGKFSDISRKVLKTWAYLARDLQIDDPSELVPIIFFFVNANLKSNPYLPTATNVLRGKEFFDKFLTQTSHAVVEKKFKDLSEGSENIDRFVEICLKVVKPKRQIG